MVALILTASYLCYGEPRAYKVRDSNEEYADRARVMDFARSFTPEEGSGGFYSSGFNFPDFFSDGDRNSGGFGGRSSFSSPFPSLESRSSDSSYTVPAGTSWKGPVSRSPVPSRGEYRQKDPILTLYDDWSPDDQPRHKWKPEEQSRNTKWSQEHPDDSSEASNPSVGSYNGQLSGPYRGTSNYNRPYSEASLKQHYKPINPPGRTHLPGQGDVRTHTHKYGVNHVYDRRKKPENPNYDQYDENLNNRKPQQFSSDPNPHRNEKHRRPSRPNDYRKSSQPSEYRNRDFSPSPPDYFKNSRNFDFFTESSNTAPTKVKAAHSTAAPGYRSTNDQLDKSCEKSNKTTTINLSDGKLSLECYDCYDVNYKRPYEQCVEVSHVDDSDRSTRRKRSVNSETIVQGEPTGREKRQHEDYYDGEGNFGPDSSDYRFGPEHFNDDYPTSYDESEDDFPEQESEKCYKSRKGDMLCISCENKNTGGTYQQCSYASDPKKNSYERSMSKVYGSPRLRVENRRKQVDGAPRKVSLKHKPYNDHSSGYKSLRGSRGYSNNGYRDGSSFRTSQARKKANSEPLGADGQSGRFRGSQGRSPLPVTGRRVPKERSLTRTQGTQGATSPKSPARKGMMSKLRTVKPGYVPKRNPPPPASRAYSTPSPVGPDPYMYDIPDPYNPDLGDIGAQGSRNRKNIDASYDPGYDETFASLFPELVDTDPTSAVALAPPSYDEYSDADIDYDDVPIRRKDQDNTPKGSKILSTPSTGKVAENTPNQKENAPIKKTCKKVRKKKMTCLQCIDRNGSKQEECTYTAEADPKSKQLTYREVKEMRYNPGSQEQVGVFKEKGDRSKRKSKKYYPEEAAGFKNTDLRQKIDRTDTAINTHHPSGRNQKSRGEPREKREDSPEEKPDGEIEKATRKNFNRLPTDPPELEDFGEKISESGEFTSETEMKFDPELGMSLPKYMLEKSEGEAIFDEILSSSYKQD